MDIGPRRDLVGDLSKAVKNTTSPFTHDKLHFGLYHSLFEWYNPMFLADKANNFTTNTYAIEKVRIFFPDVTSTFPIVEPHHGSLSILLY